MDQCFCLPILKKGHTCLLSIQQLALLNFQLSVGLRNKIIILSNFLIPCRLTCKHNTHPDCVDSKLLGVNGKERENGGESRKEEEEVGLDGDQRGVDFEHHLVLMRLLAVWVAKCHVSPEYRHVVSREGNVP